MDDHRIGKYLAYVLRHHPDDLGLELDPHGYVDAGLLIERMAGRGYAITMTDLQRIVDNDQKGRYALRDGRVRANQGHSVETAAVDLTPVTPPPVLYHGTTTDRWEAIQQSGGLQRMQRHHVHLAADMATARQVGSRHRSGRLQVLTIDAAAMHAAGLLFYQSENDVWLTDTVPLNYIAVVPPSSGCLSQ